MNTSTRSLIDHQFLHDSSLVIVRRRLCDSLDLVFRQANGEYRLYSFSGDATPIFWASGMTMPSSVGRAILFDSYLDLENGCPTEIWPDVASRLVKAHRDFIRQPGWALVIEFNWGDPIAVFGRGRYAPSVRPLVEADGLAI